MREVPTPAWITSQQLNGPTYLVNQYSAKGALAPAWSTLRCRRGLGPRHRTPRHVCRHTRYRRGGHRSDGVLRLPFPIPGIGDLACRWYVMINRLVRLDNLVKASVTSGSYTHLTLRDGQGGSINIQVTATLPHVRSQVVRGIMQGLQRGLHVDERTARALGLKIQKL